MVGERSGDAPRGPGRPRSIDRAAALDRAIDAFWRGGYAGTSLDDLTGAMGVSRPTLYDAFGGKRALFLSAIDRYAGLVGGAAADALDAALEAGDTPRAAATAFLRAALDGQTREDGPHGCLIACCAAASATTVEGVADRMRAIHDASLDRLAAALSRRMPDRDARLRASRLLDAMNAQALRARAGVPRETLANEIEMRVAGALA